MKEETKTKKKKKRECGWARGGRRLIEEGDDKLRAEP